MIFLVKTYKFWNYIYCVLAGFISSIYSSFKFGWQLVTYNLSLYIIFMCFGIYIIWSRRQLDFHSSVFETNET